jgi:hypothetical protein
LGGVALLGGTLVGSSACLLRVFVFMQGFPKTFQKQNALVRTFFATRHGVCISFAVGE